MKKDQEELRIKESLEQFETVSDKYFKVKEYIELSGYPVIKFDFFLLEILNITGSILYTLVLQNKNLNWQCYQKINMAYF